MARRPSKKSKAGRTRITRDSGSALHRWETADDIPLDEEETFHASKDKILLEGDSWGTDEEEDEVFALKGLERDEAGDDDDDDDDDEYEGGGEEDIDLPDVTKSSIKQPGKRQKRKAKNSDEEEEEEEEETWGRGKAAYYSSNAAELESDDEEGHELELQEAMLLQRKAREGMHDDDFGLNDKHVLVQNTDNSDEFLDLPKAASPNLSKNKKSLIRHLERTNPEALALARDWDDTAYSLVRTQQKIANLQATNPDALTSGMAHLHYQALLTYATTLAFYLHLRANPKYAKRPDLLTSHPIMQRLLTLKQSVSTLEDLGFAVSDSEPEFDEDDDESLDWDDDGGEEDTGYSYGKNGLELDELSDLLQDAQMPVKPLKTKPVAPQPLDDKPPKKKRKLSSDISTSIPVFDLEEPEYVAITKSTSRSRTESDLTDAYGEATHLQAMDAADKNARKKTLRFHTAKIESTSVRRQGVRNQVMGGDDDIPYRERQKEKEARLLREAQNRLKKQGGEDLNDSEPTQRMSDKRKRDDHSGDEDVTGEADGYYELVKKKNKEQKEQKNAEYEAVRAAERIVDEPSTNGPRSLSRAILTNKGLTPHRPKAVRNPRVKKRQKYEKAKKKLASQKAVYKGGLTGTGGRYEGEKSGISKVVKSVKLG